MSDDKKPAITAEPEPQPGQTETAPPKPNAVAVLDQHPMDGLMPVMIADKLRLAGLIQKSGIVPEALNTAEKVFIALQTGHELGLSPMMAVNNIHVIKNRATLSADLVVARCRKSPDFLGMSITFTGAPLADDRTCTVKMRRKSGDQVDEFEASFSLGEAKRASLYGNPKKENWTNYPDRMLKARAAAWCGRDAFPEMLAGVYTPDEAASGAVFEELPEEERIAHGPAVVPSDAPAQPEPQPEVTERRKLLNRVAACMAETYPNSDKAIFEPEEAQAYAKLCGETKTEGLEKIAQMVEEERDKRRDAKEIDRVATEGWGKTDKPPQGELFDGGKKA